MMRFHSHYRRYAIYRQSTTGGITGCRLPWTAASDEPALPSLAADTLEGLRSLIRRQHHSTEEAH